jgi:hypothetical protein
MLKADSFMDEGARTVVFSVRQPVTFTIDDGYESKVSFKAVTPSQGSCWKRLLLGKVSRIRYPSYRQLHGEFTAGKPKQGVTAT